MPAATRGHTTTLIVPSMVEGELRILDTDLAIRLGFAQPRDIRKLIKRYEAELSKMGVCATVAQTSGARGGRPTDLYYLNKKQAVFITAKSETPEATAITIEIIERFDAYERGGRHTSGRPTLAPDDIVAQHRQAVALFRSMIQAGRLAGMHREGAAVAASAAVKVHTGIDLLAALQAGAPAPALQPVPPPVDRIARTDNEQRALDLVRQVPEAARPLLPMILRRFGDHGPDDAELRAKAEALGLKTNTMEKLLALLPPHPMH